MSHVAISVLADPARALTFDVVVRDARSESRHRGRRRPLVLDREPKESILAVFDMRVIRRYFPEFDDAFPGYLARLGGAPG
jgi:hypothetical protein